MIWRTAKSTEVKSRQTARPARAAALRSGSPARRGRVEPVAARVGIPLDRHVHAIAQVLKVTLEGGTGDFQRLEESPQRHARASAQQLLDLVEALSAFHGRHPEKRKSATYRFLHRASAPQSVSLIC